MNEVNINYVKDAIRAHATDSHPNECCGLIVAKGQKQEAVRCRNLSKDPRHNFLMSPEDYREAEKRGEVLMSYHSHHYEPPIATMADKTSAEKNELPCLICSWPADTWEIYTPTGWRAELKGRPFIYGVLDCYTLFQDYYREKLGVELPDIFRDEDWIKRGENLYLDNLEKNGFMKVNDLRQHDAVVMQLDAKVPNHIAVYLGDGMILHHPPGHLSGEHPYVAERGYYSLCTWGIFRHSALHDNTSQGLRGVSEDHG